ncbi:MAG: hypothetical protein KGL39_33850 [Patescibacteria group bacterium]|nr:hypothetical protein [Patescibacteria group bacterium]
MGEEGIPLNGDASAIAKLKKGPVEIEVDLHDGEEKAGSFKCWLHPLTPHERALMDADVVEVYRFWKQKDGEDVNIARRMMIHTAQRMLVFLALRVGQEKNSKHVFSDQEEVLDLNAEVIAGINGRYVDEFDLTGKERGNLLRARGLSILSALPATSPEPASLEPTSQN